MKYQHLFELKEKTDHSHLYYADGHYVQLTFFEHMMRVAVYRDEMDLLPTFSICPGTSKMPRFGRKRLSNKGLKLLSQKEDKIQIDGVHISINPLNFLISYYKEDRLFFRDREILSYNFEGELGKGSTHYLSREEGEEIFGLGDKTGPVNKAGCHFRLETFDAMGFNANSSDPLYKQIPFYICRNSNGSYGIFYDTYSNGEIDFGKEHNNYYEPYKYFRCEEENLVYYVIFGSVEEIVERFTYLMGKSFLPPKWSFRYCGSTMAYTDSDHPMEELRNFQKKCEDYQIDCGGFYLSSGYTQIGEKRYVFHWNEEKFPDPKAFAEELISKGIHFLPNVKPAFLTTHPLYDFVQKKGWFLHYQDGSPYVFPFWGGMGSYLDFTHPEAYAFWTKCVKTQLVDKGYPSIWNDNNEYDIHDEAVYCHGFGKEIPAKRIRPLFPLLMSQASGEALDPNQRHMMVTRSGPAGFQRLAQTWTGDNNTSFEDFRGNHKMAMTAALTGFTFIGQDIGGFAGPKPTRELFLRWIAYGLFMPRFTLHSWNPDGSSTMPWLYEDAKEQVKVLFALRKRLLPYLYSEAMDAIETYHPLVYPLFLKYPSFNVESDLFFVGENILAAPIFNEGKETLEVDLPEGYFFYDGHWYSGRHSFVNHPGDRPVYFVKEGSIVPVEEDGKIVFEVYPNLEGEMEYRYYSDDSSLENPCCFLEVICTPKVVRVKGLSKDSLSLVDRFHRHLIVD